MIGSPDLLDLEETNPEALGESEREEKCNAIKMSKHGGNKKTPVSIICPICSQIFYKPMLLPCMHTFCSPCLERVQEVEDAVTCFTCRTEFTDLRHGIMSFLPDYTMMNLIYTLQGKIFCTSCVNEGAAAVSRCTTCNNFLCFFCAQAHDKLLIFSKHNTVELVTHGITEEDRTNESKSIDQPYGCLLKCLVHKKKNVTHFCYTCNITVCKKCVTENHNGQSHILDPISVVSKHLGLLISQAVRIGKFKLQQYVRIQGKSINEVETYYKGNKDKIAKWYDRFILILNKTKQEQLQKLDSHYGKYLLELYISRKINRASKKIKFIRELHSNLKKYISEAQLSCNLISDIKIKRRLNRKIKVIEYNMKFIPKAKDIISDLIKYIIFFIGSSYQKSNFLKSFVLSNANDMGANSNKRLQKVSNNLLTTYKKLRNIQKLIPQTHSSKFGLRITYYRRRVVYIIEKIMKIRSYFVYTKHISDLDLDYKPDYFTKHYLPIEGDTEKPLLSSASSSSCSEEEDSASESSSLASDFGPQSNFKNVDYEEESCRFVQLSSEVSESTSDQGSEIDNDGSDSLEICEDSKDRPSLDSDSKDNINCSNIDYNTKDDFQRVKQESKSDVMCQTEEYQKDVLKLKPLTEETKARICQVDHVKTTENSSALKSEVTRCTMYYHNKFGLFSGAMVGQFYEPNGVAVNEAGDIIVADTNNNRVQVFSMSGKFKFKFGHDGRLLYPNRVAVSLTTGEIVVSERAPTPQIQVFDRGGKFLRMFGSDILKFPRGLAVDNDGNIIVAESKIIRVTIFNLEGKLVSMFYSNKLRFPISVDVNNQGEIFICDNLAHCVFVFNYNGLYLRQIGEEGITNYPFAVAVSASGEVFVADNHNSFNLSIFTKNGHLLSALKGKSKHLQCLDVAIGRNGSLVLTSKDNRVYIYSYAFY